MLVNAHAGKCLRWNWLVSPPYEEPVSPYAVVCPRCQQAMQCDTTGSKLPAKPRVETTGKPRPQKRLGACVKGRKGLQMFPEEYRSQRAPFQLSRPGRRYDSFGRHTSVNHNREGESTISPLNSNSPENPASTVLKIKHL